MCIVGGEFKLTEVNELHQHNECVSMERHLHSKREFLFDSLDLTTRMVRGNEIVRRVKVWWKTFTLISSTSTPLTDRCVCVYTSIHPRHN